MLRGAAHPGTRFANESRVPNPFGSGQSRERSRPAVHTLNRRWVAVTSDWRDVSVSNRVARQNRSKDHVEHAEEIFYVRQTDPVLQVPLAVLPLQLFVYYTARVHGLNVDQPRNLAQPVPVE